MVDLSQPRAGVIEVNFANEPSFNITTHGLDLTFGLTTKGIKSSSIEIDDGGDPASVIAYLMEALSKAGFQTRVESALEGAFRAMQEEVRQIKRVRTSNTKGISFAHPSKLGIKRILL